MRKLLAAALLATLALFAVGCGDDDGAGVRDLGGDASSGSGPGSGSGSTASGSEAATCIDVGDAASAEATVEVTLSEWAVELSATELTSGATQFALHNDGEDAHEFVVVRADSVDELPLAEDETVDEAGLEPGAFINEVEPFPSGEECSGTFELEAGKYVAFCNVLETHEGELENHFQLGMNVEFEVR